MPVLRAVATLSLLFGVFLGNEGVSGQSCVWDDQYGHHDMTPLAPNADRIFSFSDKGTTFYGNPCYPVPYTKVPPSCRTLGIQAPLYMLRGTQCFAGGNFADSERVGQVVYNGFAGASILYPNGSPLPPSTSVRLKTIFLFRCVTEESGPIEIMEDLQTMSLVVVWPTRYGCSRGFTDIKISWGWPFIFWFIFIVAIYVGGGMLINQRKYGLTGLESMPHVDFWREIPGLVKDGCVFTYDHVKARLGKTGYDQIGENANDEANWTTTAKAPGV